MKHLLHSNSVIFILAVLLLVAQLLHEPLFELFYFEKSRILTGEFWRMVTAFVVHSNWPHTLLNVTGLIALGWFWQGAISQRHWCGLMLASALFVALAYLLWYPAGTRYFGFSAILYSIIAALCLITLSKQPWMNSILLGLTLTRILSQQLDPQSTQSLSDLIDAPVASMSHLFGLVFGLIWGLSVLVHNRPIQQQHRQNADQHDDQR